MINKFFNILVVTLFITATVLPVTGTMNNDYDIESISATELISDNQPWTLQFSFDVTLETGASGNAGSEFDGAYFYTTRWASNLLHQFDSTGNLIKEFSITGVSSLRDLAYCPVDGLLYGGAAAGTIWGFDPIYETLEVTLTGSFECRAIAYDEDLDVFYVSNWGDPVWVIDRATGSILSQFDLVTTTSTYGFAYDNVCNSGGPYLWVFDQGDGAGLPQYIHQWDLTTSGYTGIQHDVSSDVGSGSGIAGGLFFTTDFEPGYATLGGLYQDGDPPGTGDWIFCYELCGDEVPNEPPSDPEIDGPSKGKPGAELCWTFHSDDPDYNKIKYIIDWGDNNTEETAYYQSCTPIEVCHTYLEEGTYIITAIAEDTKEARSDESTFEVSIPRIRTRYYWYHLFLERFPNILYIFATIHLII